MRTLGLLLSQLISTDALIAAGDPVFRQNNLPDLVLPGAENPGTQQKIIPPHPPEPFIVAGLELGPVGLEIVPPCHKGLIVIRPYVF